MRYLMRYLVRGLARHEEGGLLEQASESHFVSRN